ncbi:hypothetical protein [Devosia neptuniae]|uniref:hypothetical protein n=1 Tax=Devosia neptuniae TaxID=191302 RepID=UPI0022AF609F|nr:hypothetical protein [Devosia neptuniae]MCZ4345540.1 hypothetical protein [Devosia neptuniae]
MSISIPIIAYALAQGTGRIATTEASTKNANNLRVTSEAITWIDGQATELLSKSGEEHYSRSSPFEYFDGRRITFEPHPYEKRELKRLLDFYHGQKICLLIPSHTALFKVYDDDVLPRVWNRLIFGYDIEVISVTCPEYPLHPSVGIPNGGITKYLIGNAMKTESHIQNSVTGSMSQRKTPWR